MPKPKNIKIQILQLRKLDKTYNEIADILDCHKSTICYHLDSTQKEKRRIKNKQKRDKYHPYQLKLYEYRKKHKTTPKAESQASIHRRIQKKISTFLYQGKNMQKFTLDDIINKFGNNPKCYITGELINIYQPSTYQFDHKTPRSRGGESTLDNLGICTKDANLTKRDKTPEELIEFCKKVLNNNGFNITKDD